LALGWLCQLRPWSRTCWPR